MLSSTSRLRKCLVARLDVGCQTNDVLNADATDSHNDVLNADADVRVQAQPVLVETSTLRPMKIVRGKEGMLWTELL